MPITKHMPELKKYMHLLLIGGVMSSLSTLSCAHEGHEQMMHMDMTPSDTPSEATSSLNHAQHQVETSFSSPTESSLQPHNHAHEHGGQIYQSTQLDTKWRIDEDGQGTIQSRLKSWIGSDENKLFVIADYSKTESEKSEQGLAALYSRNIADFWDVQTGINYRNKPAQATDQQQYEAVLGVHGMAPYFFETDAHVYIGQHQQSRFVLETERDVLLTQKLIMQPYLELEWVLQDQSRYAAKTGLSDAEIGIKTRYELVRNRVMPFVDVGYAYNKGQKATDWQKATDSETGWNYAVGLRLKF